MPKATNKLCCTYRIQSVAPKIRAVVIKDKYDRAMSFCRVQEFYESPSRRFHGKPFSMWDYMEWYAKKYGRGFSYGHDWSGFNVPSSVAVECMNKNGIGKNSTRFETPYDKVMHRILGDIKWKTDLYLIGTARTSGSTFQHEICHGKYHTDSEYRQSMDKITMSLPRFLRQKLENRLAEMGYGKKVFNDEIQAYMQYGYCDESFLTQKERADIDKKSGNPLKYYHTLYRQAAKKHEDKQKRSKYR